MYIEVVKEINAPIDLVWEVLADFGGFDKIFTDIELREANGQGLGATRGGWVPVLQDVVRELCVQCDPESHTLGYTVMEPSPLPVKNYVAIVKLTAVGKERCRVSWASYSKPMFPETMLAEAALRGLFEHYYGDGIAGLERVANTAASR